MNTKKEGQIKIRIEITKIANSHTVEKINTARCYLFEKTNKIENLCQD